MKFKDLYESYEYYYFVFIGLMRSMEEMKCLNMVYFELFVGMLDMVGLEKLVLFLYEEI